MLQKASLAAWLGNDTEYSAIRQSMLDWMDLSETSGIRRANDAERAAKAICLRPLADPKIREAVLALARKGVELGRGQSDEPWFQLALGMAEYRAGNYRAAANALATVPSGIIKDTWRPNLVTVTADFYLAMSLFQAGDQVEAGELLSAAESKMAPLPSDEKDPLADVDSHDYLVIWMAYKEAKALLGDKEADLPPAQ